MIKHADSHLDHNLTDAQVAFIMERFANRDAFFIETIELPEELGTVPCGLYGPIMGDAPVTEPEVSYAARGARGWSSRLVAREPRPSRQITIIAGPHDGNPCVLFTAFGGPVAPQEPGDIRRQLEEIERKRYGLSDLSDEHKTLTAQIETLREKRAQADAFWAQHALAK